MLNRNVAAACALLAALLGGCLVDKDMPQTPAAAQSEAVSANIVISSVFPRTPMIAVGGATALTAVVTDGAGTVLESTSSNPISVVWRSSNPSIARISESGSIFGASLGSAEITAYATRGGERSADYTAIVNVTKRNSSDVAELFFNPSQAYIDMSAERTFRLSAVDHAGAATSLSEGRALIEASNENVSIEPREIALTPLNAAVEIKVRGLQKGFAFITPYYELSSKDGKETVRVSGAPLTVQVKDSVETSVPTLGGYFDAGNYLAIAIGETGGYKTIYAAHYDKGYGALLESEFHTSWKHAAQSGGLNTLIDAGRSAAIALSPFADSRGLPLIAALKNRRINLYYQRAIGGGFQEYDLGLTNFVADINNSAYYDNSSRLIGISAFDGGDGGSPLAHIAYYDDSNLSAPRVCLLTLTNERAVAQGSQKCANTPANSRVHSVSIAHNRVSGEPRAVYGYSRYIDDQNSSTNVEERLFYLSKQNGDLYQETIAVSDGNVSFASIALDRDNKPFIAAKEGGYARIYSREAHKATNSFVWERDAIAAVNPFQGRIMSLSFAIDSFNEPRVTYSADTGGGLRIYYARKPPFRYLGSRWTIEEPGQNLTDGDQGESSAIAIDSANRAHIVYSLSARKWFNYWAEPNFFDYRNYPAASYTGADLITAGAIR